MNKVFIRNSVLLLLILLVALYRIALPNDMLAWANFTPVGAVALFAGAYFRPRWKAFITPLWILFLSDIFINKAQGYPMIDYSMIGVYISFIVMALIATRIRKVNVTQLFAATILATLAHWLITDIQPWWYSTPADGVYYYTKDVAGFIRCLTMAIPFEIKFLQGTVLFNILLFGGFELLSAKVKILQVQELPNYKN